MHILGLGYNILSHQASILTVSSLRNLTPCGEQRNVSETGQGCWRRWVMGSVEHSGGISLRAHAITGPAEPAISSANL